MSFENDSDAGTVRQQQIEEICNQPNNTDKHAELIELACILLRIAVAVCQSKAMASICRRITLLSGAAWLPSSGHGDTNAVAACLNVSENAVDHQTVRNNIPSKRPGQSRMFAFADITGTFAGPDDDSGEKLRPCCATKKPASSDRKNAGKK